MWCARAPNRYAPAATELAVRGPDKPPFLGARTGFRQREQLDTLA